MLEMIKYKDKCVDLATHAIGMDNKGTYTRQGRIFYKPYRNYFATSRDSNDFKEWSWMEQYGYAKSLADGNHVLFRLTRAGLDWLGKKIGVHIYDEED